MTNFPSLTTARSSDRVPSRGESLRPVPTSCARSLAARAGPWALAAPESPARVRTQQRSMATRRLAQLAAGGGVAAAVATVWAAQPAFADGSERRSRHPWEDAGAQPAGRSAQLAALRRGGFDVLIIGGARGTCARAKHTRCAAVRR